MSRDYFKIEDRRNMILAVAVTVASKPGGWSGLTRTRIAKAAKCSDALISRCLGDMQSVRKAIIRVAIQKEILSIVSQSVAAQDGFTIPKSLRRTAITHLLEK
jgi:hypothetical protein